MAVNIAVRKSVLRKVSNVLAQPAVNYSQDKVKYIDNPTLEGAKRGTGYRSSFNGEVCTVFGASGFLGKSIIGRLGKYGTQIVVPHRTDLYDVLPLRVYGDLGQIHFTPFWAKDDETIRRALKYSTIAINCIGRETDVRSFTLEQVHIDIPRKIARICKELGVKRLIHISALNCSPNPEQFYVKGGSRFYKTKYYGELAVREEFPDAIIVRPSDVAGFSDRFFGFYNQTTRLIAGNLHLWNRGIGIIKQPIYLFDFCHGIYEIFRRRPEETAGKTYQFIGPYGYELHDLCKFLMHVQRKDEFYGVKIIDSRVDIFFRLWMEMRDKYVVTQTPKGTCKERYDRESTSDTLDPNLPTIADLGVPLTTITDVAYDELFLNNACKDAMDDVFFDDPPPMPKIVRSLQCEHV